MWPDLPRWMTRRAGAWPDWPPGSASGSIFCISRVLAFFPLKFPNFRYHGNRGCLMYISTTPLNSLTLKTPAWCNIRSSISCISRVLANFVFENHWLVTMVTRVGQREISTTVLNCLTVVFLFIGFSCYLY